jgi:multisubunit Na+/H+ antiporter MnhB subunit
MGLGFSTFLIAIGAILAFAVTYEVAGVDIQVVGWILLVVGLIGLVLSMVFWSSWGGPAYWSRRRTYVDEEPPPV